MYLLMRSDDEDDRRATWFIVLAWLAARVFAADQAAGRDARAAAFAFAFVEARPPRDASARDWRSASSARSCSGVARPLPFHPARNPVALFAWLLERYRTARTCTHSIP